MKALTVIEYQDEELKESFDGPDVVSPWSSMVEGITHRTVSKGDNSNLKCIRFVPYPALTVGKQLVAPRLFGQDAPCMVFRAKVHTRQCCVVRYTMPCLTMAAVLTLSSGQPEMMQSLLAEAWHPNILEVHAAIVNPPFVYIAIELQGECRSIAEAALPPEIGLRAARDVCRCLDHLCRHGYSTTGITLQDFVAIGKDLDSAEGAWDVRLTQAPPLGTAVDLDLEVTRVKQLINELCSCTRIANAVEGCSSLGALAKELNKLVQPGLPYVPAALCFASAVRFTDIKLGEGNFGSVQLVEADVHGLHCQAACKSGGAEADLPYTLEDDFLEAKLMARIAVHPNITPLLAVHASLTNNCCAAHLLVGVVLNAKTCDEFLQSENLDSTSFEATTVGVLIDTISALEHLHLHTPAIVHRDIAPRNVLVDERGKAFLCDFGLSRVVSCGAYVSDGSRGMYQKPLHRCPREWLSTSVWAPASDVFMFALMMVELGTRQQLWEGMESDDVIHCLYEGDISLKPLQDGLQCLQPVVDKCLRRNHSERPSATEVKTQLQNWKEELSSPTNAIVEKGLAVQMEHVVAL